MLVKKLQVSNKEGYSNNNICVTNDGKTIIECDYSKAYGMGGRYHAINQKGYKVKNVVDEVFCNQGEQTYFPLPFFLLNNGYAIFIDTKRTITVDFSDQIVIEGLDIENDSLYIFEGNYDVCVRDFVDLTGPMMKAPKWVFGPWISAHRWNNQEMIEDVQEKLKSMHIPVSALVIEQWSDEATFYIFNGAKYPDKKYLCYEDFSFEEGPWPDPKGMIDNLHEDGIKLVLWQCPVVKHIPADEPFNERHDKEWHYVKEAGLVVEGPDEAYRVPSGRWFEGSMLPDFTNEETCKWWFGNRQYLLDIGVDGFKTDGGEFIYSEAHNSIGESEMELKNNYPLEYVKAYHSFLGKEQVAFSRAGYVGQQQFTLQWAGDQKSTYKELKAIYNSGINASLCGQINWGFDIGGFSGELPSKDLYYRANQLAVFSPIMQVHSEPVGGQFSVTDPIRAFNNERTPWNMAKEEDEFLKDIRGYYNLRMNLLPYIYSEYLKSLESIKTLMKHMNVVYEGVYGEEQYVFGELIVAPVLEAIESNDSNKKTLTLPEGVFYNLFTGEKVSGGTSVHDVAMNNMLVYVPEGTAIVTQKATILPEIMTNNLDTETLVFWLYGNSGSYEYRDDNESFTIVWDGENSRVDGTTKHRLVYKKI